MESIFAATLLLALIAVAAGLLIGAISVGGILLILVGAVAGFGSGLSGAGGPLFSAALMRLLGFAPLGTIGASQVPQVVAATSGTIGNLQYGSIDFAKAGWITLCELAGIGFGARAAHAVRAETQRRTAGALFVAVGLYMAAATAAALEVDPTSRLLRRHWPGETP